MGSGPPYPPLRCSTSGSATPRRRCLHSRDWVGEAKAGPAPRPQLPTPSLTSHRVRNDCDEQSLAPHFHALVGVLHTQDHPLHLSKRGVEGLPRRPPPPRILIPRTWPRCPDQCAQRLTCTDGGISGHAGNGVVGGAGWRRRPTLPPQHRGLCRFNRLHKMPTPPGPRPRPRSPHPLLFCPSRSQCLEILGTAGPPPGTHLAQVRHLCTGAPTRVCGSSGHGYGVKPAGVLASSTSCPAPPHARINPPGPGPQVPFRVWEGPAPDWLPSGVYPHVGRN